MYGMYKLRMMMETYGFLTDDVYKFMRFWVKIVVFLSIQLVCPSPSKIFLQTPIHTTTSEHRQKLHSQHPQRDP